MLLSYLKYDTNEAKEVGLMLELMVFPSSFYESAPAQQSSGSVTTHHGLQAMVCANWCEFPPHIITLTLQCNVKPTFHTLMKRHLSPSCETRPLSSDSSANPEATNNLFLCIFNHVCIFLQALEGAFRSFTTSWIHPCVAATRGESHKKNGRGDVLFTQTSPVKV